MKKHNTSAAITPKVSKSLIVISSSSHIFDHSPTTTLRETHDHNTSTQRQKDEHHTIRNAYEDDIEFGIYLHNTNPDHRNPSSNHQHEVFIGNLRHDLSDLVLIQKIQNLFDNKAGILIPGFRLTIVQRNSKKHPRKYAFLALSGTEDEENAYKLSGLKNLDFVVEGLSLNVTKRISTRHKNTKWNKITFNGRKCLLMNRSRSDSYILQTSSNDRNKSYVTENIKYNSRKVSSSMRRAFFYGQRLPTEDRVTEYKRGSGNYMKATMIHHVRKYVCAFLNSEGGRLMIGVDDTCKVFGVSCTRRQEDIARCQIDNTIKQFQPHVSPHMYMVEFIPVRLMPNDTVEFDYIDPLLKVLEVSVVRQNIMTTLYATDKDIVYVRRDGSVEGPLRISQIVEWFRTNFASQLNNNNQSGCSKQQQNNSIYQSNCSIAELIRNVTQRQEEVLKQMEDGLAEGTIELKNQIKLLQTIIEKKENKVRDLTQSLIQALANIERERRNNRRGGKHGRRNALVCTVL